MFVRDLDLKDVVTFAGKEYLVSTVQLTDTAMTFDRLLFGISDIQRYETMIFAYNNGDLDYIDLYCERYDTKEEAIKGHNEIRKGREDAWAEVVSNENKAYAKGAILDCKPLQSKFLNEEILMNYMEKDKLYHFIAGLILSLIGGYFNPLYGLILGIQAGIGKEVYDYYDYGLFDKKDMLFTWLGAIIGYSVWNY